MSKNKVKVIIGGNIYAVQGDEAEEHIQKVAALINHKIDTIQKTHVRTNLNTSKIYMLTALNISNEYIKAEEELALLKIAFQQCSDENQALKANIEQLILELKEAKKQIDSTQINHTRTNKNRGR